MAKKLRFPFVTVEVTPLKAEKEYEHNNLSTWKRQTRRNKISLAAKSDAYSQMLQEHFFLSFFLDFLFFSGLFYLHFLVIHCSPKCFADRLSSIWRTLLPNSCMPLSCAHYCLECSSDPCTTILCVKSNCISYTWKPSRSVIPVCPCVAVLSLAVPSLGKGHFPHYQVLNLCIKKVSPVEKLSFATLHPAASPQ